jgi:short-subunit dehydrogenase
VKRILVLGASSQIGSCLARAFAADSELFLAGRDAGRLNAAAEACRGAGATGVAILTGDLGQGGATLLAALSGQPIDLVIDAASACSSARDAEIDGQAMRELVTADFSSRTELFEGILRGQPSAPAVIYISTALTLVRSPGRTVYTALKSLYEVYLRKLGERRPDFRLLVVRVGTVVETRRASGKPEKLANAVRKAFADRRENLFFGGSGVLLVGLFYLQPVVFHLVTFAQRKARTWLGGGGRGRGGRT